MKKITATELARNLRQVLDCLMIDGEEIVIERNQREIARLLPGTGRQTALQAMADLYRTLPEDAAAAWEKDSRRSVLRDQSLRKGVHDPWAS